MPDRDKLSASFFTAALACGLNAAILNPLSKPFTDAIHCWSILSGHGFEDTVSSKGKSLEWVIGQYDAGKIFLPELLAAAGREIEKLRQSAVSGVVNSSSPVILASVEGDIHDIGKNIVKAMLECHGFAVIDLGTDVSAGSIVEAARQHSTKLVGLSALMTTTVRNMQTAVDMVKAQVPGCAVMIGGAAADASVSSAAIYGRDAMEAVAIAKKVYGTEEEA
jgi:5-methyltetrahydrofolate--homocysteine methyltransferase